MEMFFLPLFPASIFIAFVQNTACKPINNKNKLPNSTMEPMASVSTVANTLINDPKRVRLLFAIRKDENGFGTNIAVLPEYVDNNGNDAIVGSSNL